VIHTFGLSPSLDVVHLCGPIAVGRIHRPYEVRRLAGGKSLNVTRALVRLGRPVRAIVPLGGPIGDLVAELLDPDTVVLERVVTSSPTRLCLTAADTAAGSQTEFYEWSPPLDGHELAAIAPLLEAIQPGEWITLSGSVPAGVDFDELTAMLTRSTDRGVRLAVDLHGPALVRLVDTAAPTVVKINRSEAAELVDDRELGALALAVQQRCRGLPTVVVTDGPAGAAGVDPNGQAWTVHTSAPPGGYPVGSGDCFLAALVADLEQDRGLDEALALANAVGAANAREPGGGLFELAVVTELHRQTRTEAG
jgi:1-phosphofructokinase family hexose kinase